MKQIKTTMLLLIIMQLALNAQNTQQTRATYSYDASGNRVQKQILIPMPIEFSISNPTDTSTTATDDINNIIAANNQNPTKEGATGITVITEGYIKVFPNPVQTNLNVRFTGNAKADGCTIQLYDGNGKIFYQATATKNQTQINMSQANAGMYYLVVITKEGKRLWWKVSKG